MDMEYYKENYNLFTLNNYESLKETNKAYCIMCFKDNNLNEKESIEKCIIDTNNITIIPDCSGYTCQCKKCYVDAMIPTNMLQNENENEIKKILNYLSNEMFNG